MLGVDGRRCWVLVWMVGGVGCWVWMVGGSGCWVWMMGGSGCWVWMMGGSGCGWWEVVEVDGGSKGCRW